MKPASSLTVRKVVLGIFTSVVWIVFAFLLTTYMQRYIDTDSQNTHGVASDHHTAVRSMITKPSGEKLSDVGGLVVAKKTLRRAVLLPLKYPDTFFEGPAALRPPKGILLHGPPGTGKTMLARALASESGASFISVSSATLEDKWWGESAKLVQACFHLARTELQPCILFFDEVDGMGRTRSEHDQACVYSFKTELLRNLDGSDVTHKNAAVVVLACTNNVSVLDPALKRRLPLQIRIDVPTEEGRLEILKKLCHGEPSHETVGATKIDILRHVSKWTSGKTGSDLSALFSDASSIRMNDVNIEPLLAQGVKNGHDIMKAIGPLRLRHWKAAIGENVTEEEDEGEKEEEEEEEEEPPTVHGPDRS